MSDDVIYQKPGILVTSSIVKIRDDTYSIRNINSVNISKEDTSGPIQTAIAIVVALCVAFWISSNLHSVNTFIVVLSLVLGAYLIKSILTIISPNYFLIFSTSNGKAQALTGKSYAALSPIKQAIETAFSRK